MLVYVSPLRRYKIRVWRSLVSRLNGVQEASSSNLDTRTKKAETVSTVSAFFFSNERFEHLNASVRGTLACRQLDGGNTIIILPSGKNNANESRHSDHLPMESWIHGSIGIFVFSDSNPYVSVL